MSDHINRVLWCLVGVFLVVTGIYFLIHPSATMVSIAWMFGLAMLVSGAVNCLIYLSNRRYYIDSTWLLANSVIDLLIGVLFLCSDWIAAAFLPILFGVWAVVSGVIKLVNAAMIRRMQMPTWGGLLVVGLVLLVFGVAVFFRPVLAAVAVSAIVAIVLITQGLLAIVRGLFASSIHR